MKITLFQTKHYWMFKLLAVYHWTVTLLMCLCMSWTVCKIFWVRIENIDFFLKPSVSIKPIFIWELQMCCQIRFWIVVCTFSGILFNIPIAGISRSVGLGLSRHWLLFTWRSVKVWKQKKENKSIVTNCRTVHNSITHYLVTNNTMVPEHLKFICILYPVRQPKVQTFPDRWRFDCIWRVSRENTFRSLSLSYQKKDGRACPRPSFFWYDTDF